MVAAHQLDQCPVLIIAGPTGIGKTQLAIDLTCSGRLEIISADSMQVYHGMRIGTAQPTDEQKSKARFHVCGMVDPGSDFNVSQFLDICSQAHQSILDRGNQPLYTGGTGLYLRALRWGIFGHQSRDEQVRQKLEMECRNQGVEVLYERLRQVDPKSAERISSRDTMRIVRALEVYASTGRPISDLQDQWIKPRARFPHRLVVLVTSRDVLRQRIKIRTEEMLKQGWIEEVEELLAHYSSTELHCFKALGYREIIQYLEGKMKRDELKDKIVSRTFTFTRRQMVWLRREHPAVWIRVEGRESMNTATGLIEKLLANI
jgi:tRNA dimethylallyltransferase